VPRGWSASVYARIPGARVLTFAGGYQDLLVPQPGSGTVRPGR
jgi:hypothetical protein